MAVHALTNVGHLDYKQSVVMDLLRLIFFYNQDSIAIILALVNVTIQFRVTMELLDI